MLFFTLQKVEYYRQFHSEWYIFATSRLFFTLNSDFKHPLLVRQPWKEVCSHIFIFNARIPQQIFEHSHTIPHSLWFAPAKESLKGYKRTLTPSLYYMNRYTLQKHISTLWIECKKVDLYCKILKLSINCGFVVTLVCQVNRRGRDESNWYKAPFMFVVSLLLALPKPRNWSKLLIVDQRKWHSKSHRNTFYKTHLCLWCFFARSL